MALEIGADDYLVKPFSLRELAARMKAILRRTEGMSGKFAGEGADQNPSADDSLQYGELRLNSRLHTAELRGKPLTLTPIEFSMLEPCQRVGLVAAGKSAEKIVSYHDRKGDYAILFCFKSCWTKWINS
jgi:response regulator RpfG family c-di-GMP phosphodiesterase